MASYEKLTLDRFKGALKEGKYESLTGARRAIGKTTSWTAKEREAAQELANKHFGGAPSTPKPKAAAKKTAKAGAKKASVKGSAKKVSAKKAAVASPPMPEVGATQRTGTTRAATAFDHRIAAHEGLQFVHNARIELEGFKQLNKSFDTTKHEKELFQILENSIGHMSASSTGGIPALGVAAIVPRIEVPKAEGASEAPQRVVRNISDDASAQAQPQETVGQVEQNGTIEDADLSPAERSARDLLQGTPDLGLPRPPQQV